MCDNHTKLDNAVEGQDPQSPLIVCDSGVGDNLGCARSRSDVEGACHTSSVPKFGQCIGIQRKEKEHRCLTAEEPHLHRAVEQSTQYYYLKRNLRTHTS